MSDDSRRKSNNKPGSGNRARRRNIEQGKKREKERMDRDPDIRSKEKDATPFQEERIERREAAKRNRTAHFVRGTGMGSPAFGVGNDPKYPGEYEDDY